MKYIIDQYKWDIQDNLSYYHLVNSKEFESDNVIEEKSYFKGGSYFTITKVDDEIQRQQSRTKQRLRNNV